MDLLKYAVTTELSEPEDIYNDLYGKLKGNKELLKHLLGQYVENLVNDVLQYQEMERMIDYARSEPNKEENNDLLEVLEDENKDENIH